ncbi:putative cadmium/zinc-transporting ATPase HMA1, chloroplastic [Silene latifolia]|uniref:putative cadmium/zinc-transporting ATPase HMA1, chloroplastic n=1 Tax=Silene latifolia TaxID=37657 RepID=UPI003D785D36
MATLPLIHGAISIKQFKHSHPNFANFRSPKPFNRLTFSYNFPKFSLNSTSCCHQHQHHHHDHDHHHHHGGDHELTKAQEAVIRFAKAIKWAQLANYFRENLRLCCFSMAMLLSAAICPYLLSKTVSKPLQNSLIFAAFPLVGVSASLDALIDIAGGKVNIHVLMALAAFASVFMGNSLEGGLLIAMFNLAHIAEEYFTSRSMVDVNELKENYPDSALVIVDEDEAPDFSNLSYKRIPVTELAVGTFVFVQAGESVPVDCVVSQGRSTITIEHLTGEVKPIESNVGDRIPGGARNLDGMLIVEASKTWKESMLSKIVQLTEEARQNKPKLQRWLDEFGEQYSKVVMVLSVAVALIGPIVFKWPFFSTPGCRGSIYRALGLMVAASPCALAVAPLAYATAISACARKGNLLKGGHALDALAACGTIAFDKTGTLTTGVLKFKAIEPIHGHHMGDDNGGPAACCVPNCQKEALAVAAAMEKGTTHPIGRAVVDHSTGLDLPSISVESFQSVPGRGLFATVSGNESGIGSGEPLKATLGSVDYIASLFKNEESRKIMEAVSSSTFGNDFVHAALSVNDKVTLFHFEDDVRSGVSDVIAWLVDQGKFKVMMLTGDHDSSAQRVANAVGITEVYSGLKPEDKLNHVVRISRETGDGLIMVGDGINDAPALAAATVSIVLAQQASATAIAVADVLLLQDNISGVPFCVAKAHQTTSLVKQNVALTLSAIVMASIPSVMGFLPLWLTVLLHEGGTLLVCLNSIRALNDPEGSFKKDLEHLLEKCKAAIIQMRQQILSSGTIQTAHIH